MAYERVKPTYIHRYQLSLISVQLESSRSMRTDRRADAINLIVTLYDFVKAP